MTREKAIKIVKEFINGTCLHMADQEAFETLIPELAESEDERIRKELLEVIKHCYEDGGYALCTDDYKKYSAYLEKQRAKEQFDRIAPIYNDKESFESALEKAWNFYNESASRKVDSLEDDYIECVFSKGFREGFLYREKQKEQKPKHFELKAGKWYICHSAFCCRADHLTVKEGERFMCEKDGVVKGFIIKEPEKYFKECSAPAPMEDKQKEQKPIKIEVHEDGKGTTICGQDYKCKKDYKAGNCWYIKDVIYHCGRDGYLTDQNGVSWSCTPEWFKEYIQSNTEWADKEKNDFVSGQFLQCKLSFDAFKENEHYWLEYVGDDMYVGRSDNILNQKFHITPRQLFTLFTQQLEEKQKEQKPVYVEIDNSKENVVFPFYARAKTSGKSVTIVDGQLSMDGLRWIKFCSDSYDHFNVYNPEDLVVEQKPVEWNKTTIKGVAQ